MQSGTSNTCQTSVRNKQNLWASAVQLRPKDTFDGSAHGKSPCEVDSNESLVDGRIEGRTGVPVESEAVLKCESNNNDCA